MHESEESRFRFLTPVPFWKVTLEDSFWAVRQRVNRERTIPAIYAKCKETGRIDAFSMAAQRVISPRVHPFWDSDVAKWVEAASYSLATYPDPGLGSLVEDAVKRIEGAQQEDGYLNVYYTVSEPENRWRQLAFSHELYCAGHLIEAAVAHHQAAGSRRLLNLACRYADHIDTTFGPGKREGCPGHPEIELALVKLYRATGEKRYLRLGQFFLEQRGKSPSYFETEMQHLTPEQTEFHRRFFHTQSGFNTEYCQDHSPVRRQREAVGHAVRAMYLYCGMADVARETEDAELLTACLSLWDDVTVKRMYVTGGIGSSGENEGFTQPYDLPNRTAYAETCAAIGLAFFAHRMLQLDPSSRYADVMERALYNVIAAGVSSDGTRFFYDNPLDSRGEHHRQEWFDVACCPPNLARLIASVGGYVYSQAENDVYVHLYAQGRGELQLGDRRVVIHQRGDYPWDGKATIVVEPEQPASFGLYLRIAGWSRKVEVSVNEEPMEVTNSNSANGYVRIARRWQPGDAVTIMFPMPVERVCAHPAIEDNIGKVALQRGPIVYCLEEVDHDVPLAQIFLDRGTELMVESRPGPSGREAVITGEGKVVDASEWDGLLYRNTCGRMKACRFTAVPYHTWDNRLPGRMRVWIGSL